MLVDAVKDQKNEAKFSILKKNFFNNNYPKTYNANPFQYSCLENPMDRGAWCAAILGVTKSQTRLSKFIFTFHFHALEKEMETHSNTLAWKIPRTNEPGRLQSMGLQRVGHD